MRRLLVFAALALCGWMAQAAALIELSPAEREWIARHGPVRVVSVRSAEPFYSSSNDNSAPQGFAVDLLNLAAERAGLQLQYRSVATIPQAVGLFMAGEADLSPIAAFSEARSRFVSFPGSLLAAQLVFVVRREMGDLSSAQSFAGRSIGTVESTVPGQMVAARFPQARIEGFDGVNELMLAVSQGRVDIGVSWQHDAVYAIEANLLGNLRVHRAQNIAGSYYGPVVSLRQPLLHGIMVRALASLTPAERAAAARRWLPSGVDTLWAPESVLLTPAERDWVQRRGEVRLGYDRAFGPFTQEGELGGFDGLGADMLRLMTAKVGLRVVQQASGSFDEVYQRALAGELNVLVGIARTKERREQFDFVGPFASAPTVLVMRSEDPRRWTDAEEINGRLGLLKSHFLKARLHSRRPGLPLVEFDSNASVLQALAQGEVDAVIGNGVVLGRLIEQRHPGLLRVTGVVPDGDSELFFGVPKGHPELARVLQKGFDALTPGETAPLERHWLMVSVQPGLRLGDLLRWGLPLAVALALVLITLVLANRRLRLAHAAEARERSAAEDANAARGRFLAYLSHELRGTLGGVSSGMQLLRQADQPELRERLAAAVQTSCDGLLQMLETTLAHERAMLTGVTLDPVLLDLPAWWTATIAPWALAAERKGLKWHTEGPADGVRVLADGGRLAQVLGNLVGNAIKFTPTGKVEVGARWLDAPRSVLQLRVQDSGPGVPAEDRERLFEPYAQGQAGREARVGAGLGLAITRQIVLAMGGTIEVSSAGAGAGALFTVEIPLEKA